MDEPSNIFFNQLIKKMEKKSISLMLVVVSCLFATSIFAKVSLPAIISSDMVLQRNTMVTLWGWGDSGEKLIIKTSWLKDPLQVTVNHAGDWEVNLQTTNSKKSQSIRINSHKQAILLENILFGEVWLCSGQSNMEIPLSGFRGQPVYDAQKAITNSTNNNIRVFSVENQASVSPVKKLGPNTGWKLSNPASVKDFSAIAYFFGKHLHDILDVPVGLIHTSWGGSLIEAWMSKEALGSIKEFDLKGVDLKRGNRFPTVLFNAMIQPLIPFTIKGAIWYQGEANVGQADLYKRLFPAMVKDWRARWGIGDFPFYYAQIAPYMYTNQNRLDDPGNAALLREAQFQCLDLIPNSGMAVTLDLGTQFIIHPPNKKDVADRLLYNALNNTYGQKAVNFSGPTFDGMNVKDMGVYLSFKNAKNGLYSFGKLDGFEIAGKDKVFYPAEASIYKESQVFVKSYKVTDPVAVRYAWRSWVTGTLFDNFLLPATSFRTDNWNDAKQSD